MYGKQNCVLVEDMTPRNIFLMMMIKIQVSRLSTDSKFISFLLRQLETSEAPSRSENQKLTPLIDFREELKSFCGMPLSGLSKGKMLNNTGASSVVSAMKFAWKLRTEEELLAEINDSYNLLSSSETFTSTSQKPIHPRSAFGRFVQKLVVASKLVNFYESSLVFERFCHYRYELHQILLSLPNADLFLTGVNELDASIHSHHGERSVVERSLRQQLELCSSISASHKHRTVDVPCCATEPSSLIEAQICFLERHGTPVPESMKGVLAQLALAQSAGMLNGEFDNLVSRSCHYLDYLEKLFEGKYIAAFDSLHRYFDYMVSRGSRNFYHFALIAKASLHQQFGEDCKALDSIEEAISVARENKDTASLNYLLCWLSKFLKNKPHLWLSQMSFLNGSDAQLEHYLARKSEDVSLSLAALGSCFFTSALLANGLGSARISQSLIQAQYVCLNDGPMSFLKSCEVASSIWSKLSAPHLSDLYVDLGLHYTIQYGNASDALTFELRRQNEIHSRAGPELVIKALDELHGKYEANIDHRRKLKYQILVAEARFNLQKGNYHGAMDKLALLKLGSRDDEDLILETVELEAAILAASDNHLDAIRAVSAAVCEPESNTCQNFASSLRLNLMKVRSLFEAGEYNRAISLLVDQIKLAKWSGHGTLLHEALIHLLRYLNFSGCVYAAYSMALRLVPMVMRTRNQQLIARTYLEISRSSHLLIDRQVTGVCVTRREIFAAFLMYLSLSISSFKQCGCLKELLDCFRLEQSMAHVFESCADELTENTPFQNFKRHSFSGHKLLQKKIGEECDREFLRI